MNVCDTLKWCLITTLVGLGANISLSNAIAASQDQADAERGVQVLTRGPVHEAFAETVTFDPQPGVVAPRTPPADIEELPPDQKPEGDNVAWIPGYWAWDDERNDFLWVSGVWRALPPGRQWLPGYWGQTSQGDQWTSGYWADATVEEVDYLPEPPGTLEVGPSTSAPSANSTWLPGCWRWHQSRGDSRAFRRNRAFQSEASKVLDCRAADRSAWRGPGPAPDRRDASAGSQSRTQTEKRSNRSARLAGRRATEVGDDAENRTAGCESSAKGRTA